MRDVLHLLLQQAHDLRPVLSARYIFQATDVTELGTDGFSVPCGCEKVSSSEDQCCQMWRGVARRV